MHFFPPPLFLSFLFFFSFFFFPPSSHTVEVVCQELLVRWWWLRWCKMISRQLEIENAFSCASYFLPKIRFVYTVYLIFFLDIKESFIEIIAFKRFRITTNVRMLASLPIKRRQFTAAFRHNYNLMRPPSVYDCNCSGNNNLGSVTMLPNYSSCVTFYNVNYFHWSNFPWSQC